MKQFATSSVNASQLTTEAHFSRERLLSIDLYPAARQDSRGRKEGRLPFSDRNPVHARSAIPLTSEMGTTEGPGETVTENKGDDVVPILMGAKEWRAQAEAYDEAAQHLEQLQTTVHSETALLFRTRLSADFGYAGT